MKVGEALKLVFAGKTLTVNNEVRPIQFHYGDQKELNLWISIQDKVRAQKYPLIWYVITPQSTAPNGYTNVNSQLILMNLTKREVLNTTRANTVYKNVINPLYDLVQSTLKSHPFVTLLDRTPLNFDDKPNYGVNESNANDFTSTNKKGEQGIATDVVDARVIPLRMKIKTDCIL